MNEKDYIELFIMSKMKYHITSNSSFGWWGAWLSESEKVVAPNKWFGVDKVGFNEIDIIPDNWIKI